MSSFSDDEPEAVDYWDAATATVKDSERVYHSFRVPASVESGSPIGPLTKELRNVRLHQDPQTGLVVGDVVAYEKWLKTLS